ncbi:DUF1641 domain-containing protein [Paenibacillus sp.]|jgi:uncharacterized protein YjgD (DUF1641 family)|uniref:DUF1641 domain-containing protein n=1 Tax=Paenibacillus sp. TaxID=58172 RepID=UPI0028254208|nr:DUF1641 domain-containing protein [Paenibacillus sp.]MDR0268232.1 DUF1641 domain-containing protein [Paenibacillus sp.]
MAEPISLIKKRVLSEEELKQQSLNQLKDSVAEHEQAIDKAIDVLNELYGSGILEATESLLKAKAKVAEIALHQAKRPEVTNIINNGIAAAGALSAISPEQTTKMFSGIAKGLEEARKPQEKKLTVFSLMGALNDPDVNRAIGFGLQFLKGLGKELGK